MKKTIHPNYHEITVVMTDKSSFTTRSTYGAAGDKLTLDIDPLTHPAWTGGGAHLVDRGGQISRFKKRYKNLGLDAGGAGGTGSTGAQNKDAEEPAEEPTESKEPKKSASKKDA